MVLNHFLKGILTQFLQHIATNIVHLIPSWLPLVSLMIPTNCALNFPIQLFDPLMTIISFFLFSLH